ncbi:hypothetical protein A1O7_07761 [Cladophialophora yegresii CBS 114405]|uniref:Fungal N-terminal domain-containing protein n=1 Tax=Cladophialophora yegresii CBS 114405 TaxID=1182544 RepID=W9VPE5_9EURO|nr:uncharacterized protein A1O7_07761 [Cladophialophora yegresii CBS 114405]EXJ57413.1 hypothetical protein A1O7_07761 [Cladophialophora yegresii CBS 114405]
MGDPFSIAASILTVLQVADSLVTFIRDLKNASEEHKNVQAEVQSLQSVLRQVYESSATTNATTGKDEFEGERFAGLEGPLETCRLHLEYLTVKLAPMHGFDKARKSVMWKMRRTEIRSILTDIERQKASLMLALQIETKSVFRASPPSKNPCTARSILIVPRTICNATQRLCIDNHQQMTEMSIRVSELKARIVSENDMISTATVTTECQRLCKGVQCDETVNQSKTDQILGPPECFNCRMINSLAEPHVLRGETTRVNSRKERKGKLAVTSRLYVQI